MLLSTPPRALARARFTRAPACAPAPVACLAVLAGCHDPEPKSEPELRHVILIQTDTLHMDRLTLYGHDRPTTPLMEAYPWQIVEGYRTVGAWTLPSIAAVMSGQEPHESGVMSFRGALTATLPAGTTLADAFRDAGYQTRLRTGNEWFVKGYGAEGGFDDTRLIKQRDNVGNMGELIAGALDGLDPARPIFLVIQPMDAHGPYMPVPEDQGRWTTDAFPFTYEELIGEERFAELWESAGTDEARRQLEYEAAAVYDEQLPELDREIDALLKQLARVGILEDALIVLTADHGESLGEDQLGFFGHSDHVWPGVGQIPLAFLGRDIPSGPRACLGQSHDLPTTLLAWAGVAPQPQMGGLDLLQDCREIARHAWYSPSALEEVAVSTESAWLTWNCVDASWRAWDLTGDAPILVDPSSLPEEAALRAEIDRFLSEIDQGCR